MTEIWKSIEGVPGYEVSDLGNVRSLDRVNSYGRRQRGQPLKPIAVFSKYGKLARHVVTVGGRRRQVHHLVLIAFVGPKPANGIEACHGDGNPANNRLPNLRWDTSKSNKEDARRHGTMIVGEKQHMAKLTEDDVRCIRAEPHSYRSQRMLSRAFGVSPMAIKHIRTGRNWAHVPQYL